MNRKQARTISFRIEGDIIDKLEGEAQRREITLNKFVNQIFRNFLEWDMLQSQAGMIPVAKPVVAEVFRKINKEEIVSLAKEVGRSSTHNIILFMKQKMDLNSFLSWLEIWIKKDSTAGFSRTKENGVHTCIMKHDLGENWSLYHKIVLETIFNEILHRPIDTIISNSTLIFKIKEEE